MGEFTQLYGGALITAIGAIVVVVLNNRRGKADKEAETELGVLKEQREGWSSLLTSKDADIARLERRLAAESARADRAEDRLALLSDADHALADRDAMIAGLVAKLGPTATEEQNP